MGRVDKKKKNASKFEQLSSTTKLIVIVFGICIVYFTLIGITFIPGLDRSIDFGVRNAIDDPLRSRFPAYQIETVNANPSLEKNNALVIGYLKKEDIQALVRSNNVQSGTISIKFNNAQFRIRELFFTPIFLLFALFLFAPLTWKNKGIGFIIGGVVLLIFLRFKLMGLMNLEISSTYNPDQIKGGLKLIPYLSSPGVVFGFVVIIWLAIVLPFTDRKRLWKMLSLS